VRSRLRPTVRALRVLVGTALVLAVTLGLAGAAEAGTWSVVAVDPASGEVGVAAASCVERNLPESAALVPGHGAGVAAGEQEKVNRNRLFRQILDDRSPAEILAGLDDPAQDDKVALRQYALVDLDGTALARTGAGNDPWSGARQGDHVSVQGTGLESPQVVDDALAAFSADIGPVNLADRLVRAMEAGSAAGGDARCNSADVRQTAASAYVMVARHNDAAYAPGAEDRNNPWLDLQVSNAKGGRNAVADLRVRYDQWRVDHLAPCADCELGGIIVPVGGTATIKESTKVGVVVLTIEGLLCLAVVVASVWVTIAFVRRRRPPAAAPTASTAPTPTVDVEENRADGGGDSVDLPVSGPGP
jgi:uncharacterized Ntn-hydrolase superfamily protein